jgi:CxxC motif-containing protein
VLTPNLDTSSLTEQTQTVKQNTNNIQNETPITVQDVQIQNYINITIPKELCAYVGGDFVVANKGTITEAFSDKSTIKGYGTVGPPLMFNKLQVEDTAIKATGTMSIFKGTLNIMPIKADRYIPKGSKWIVVFLGGDINYPQLIGRYTDPDS